MIGVFHLTARTRVPAFAAAILLVAVVVWAQTPTAINDLTFGNVFPGIPKEIDKKAAGSAGRVQYLRYAGRGSPDQLHAPGPSDQPAATSY